MTLILSNDDVGKLLTMRDCIDVLEDVYVELSAGRGVNRVRSDCLVPSGQDDALYSLKSMDGVIPKLGVGAVRIDSDIVTWPKQGNNMRRVKVPAAPGNRYVGLVLLFSSHTGEPLAIMPDGVMQRIRVGAGGIMLPNHAPLPIAEQFGTLAELHPGRIDLGLGRAPGTDQRTLQALRRDPSAAERFPQDVLELQGYLTGQSLIPGIDAYPGKGTNVPLYILGSSAFGAQLAAQLGLGYAFASHFAPQMLEHAARLYREHFEPSEALAEPHFIAAANVIAADTEEVAEREWQAAQRARIRMMLGRGRTLTDDEVEMLLHSPAGQQVLGMLECTAVGTGPTTAAWLHDFAARVQADELIITTAAQDAGVRRRTLELLGEHVVRA